MPEQDTNLGPQTSGLEQNPYMAGATWSLQGHKIQNNMVGFGRHHWSQTADTAYSIKCRINCKHESLLSQLFQSQTIIIRS